MAELVWDRPLDPRADADVWLSRAADVERVVDLARDGDGVVFLWAPPGWGTTTFLRELALAAEGRFRVRMIDARDVGELDTDTSGTTTTGACCSSWTRPRSATGPAM